MPIAKPSKGAETRLDQRLAQLREEYPDEERAAAEEETTERDERDRASSVYSVRLPRDVYDAVRDAAQHAHLTPSALIRQWVSERVAAGEGPDDLSDAVASLRRDVERVAKLVRPA